MNDILADERAAVGVPAGAVQEMEMVAGLFDADTLDLAGETFAGASVPASWTIPRISKSTDPRRWSPWGRRARSLPAIWRCQSSFSEAL